jgi:hypothetical protein
MDDIHDAPEWEKTTDDYLCHKPNVPYLFSLLSFAIDHTITLEQGIRASVLSRSSCSLLSIPK